MQYIISTSDEKGAALKAVAGLDLAVPWVVTVEKKVKKRSLDQNALAHRWFHIIADETGNDFEDVKSTLKDMFLPMKMVKVGPVGRMIKPSTSKLSVPEMSKFMDKVQAFAATELNISLPNAEDLL